MPPLDLRTLALTVIVGAVLMLAAYGAVWAGVRWWMGKVAAPSSNGLGGERASQPSAAVKSDVRTHRESGVTR